jgi:hypothetical protein
MRGARVATTLLVFVAASACRAPLSGDDLLMCNAAQSLTASIAITEETFALEMDEQPEQAVERAVQALGLAEGAARALHEVVEATQAKPAWQSLIRAYKHAADAASSMHPNFPELHGTGQLSLSAAREALDGARTSLPPACFAMAAS